MWGQEHTSSWSVRTCQLYLTTYILEQRVWGEAPLSEGRTGGEKAANRQQENTSATVVLNMQHNNQLQDIQVSSRQETFSEWMNKDKHLDPQAAS